MLHFVAWLVFWLHKCREWGIFGKRTHFSCFFCLTPTHLAQFSIFLLVFLLSVLLSIFSLSFSLSVALEALKILKAPSSCYNADGWQEASSGSFVQFVCVCECVSGWGRRWKSERKGCKPVKLLFTCIFASFRLISQGLRNQRIG